MAYCGIGVCHDNGGGGGGGELSFSNFTLEGQLQIWLLRNFDKERSGGNGNESVRGEFTWVKIHCLNLMKWEVLSKFIHSEEMWSYGKFLAIKNATITPLSYVGGEVVWFRKDAGDEVKYFSINLRTKNLKLINHDDMPLAILPFIPHHLPCPI
ncbi:hypothetical protein Scep_017519 [Stephania cephalantha]|uniref:Uncharacterized protein n=1 Tax=Stephania cephalantha TaxID=152367 RepID=A0AAP0NX07_9MAGN